MGKRGPKRGDPRCVAAGQKGGQATREKHGMEFFQAIGRKGGQTTLETYGPEFFRSISNDRTSP